MVCFRQQFFNIMSSKDALEKPASTMGKRGKEICSKFSTDPPRKNFAVQSVVKEFFSFLRGMASVMWHE